MGAFPRCQLESKARGWFCKGSGECLAKEELPIHPVTLSACVRLRCATVFSIALGSMCVVAERNLGTRPGTHTANGSSRSATTSIRSVRLRLCAAPSLHGSIHLSSERAAAWSSRSEGGCAYRGASADAGACGPVSPPRFCQPAPLSALFGPEMCAAHKDNAKLVRNLYDTCTKLATKTSETCETHDFLERKLTP